MTSAPAAITSKARTQRPPKAPRGFRRQKRTSPPSALGRPAVRRRGNVRAVATASIPLAMATDPPWIRLPRTVGTTRVRRRERIPRESLAVPYARVENSVEHVHEEVHAHDHRHDE